MEIGVTMKNIFFFLFLFTSLISGKTDRPYSHTRTANEAHTIWDGNQISNIHGNHGDISSYHISGNSGMHWPKVDPKNVIFQSGLWVAAGSINGTEEIRTAVSEYLSEFVPGSIDGGETSGHIFEIHKAEMDAFLENDWNTFSSMTLPLPVTLIEGAMIYTEIVETNLPTDNFMNWPIDDGAPWHDENDDGVYSPQDGDHPKIKGDMFHWYVMNDFDESEHFFNTAPLGLTVRISVYGFDTFSPLENALFVEWEIENTGENELDSIIIGWWSDADLGNHTDDFSGCDPAENLGYTYNEGYDLVYGQNVPAIGVQMLQGPVVPSEGDTAWVFGEPILDSRNLNLSAFTIILGGSPVFPDPNSPEEIYNYLNGLNYQGEPFIDPTTYEETPFFCNGDPVTGSGWVDMFEYSSSDRRMISSMGPFSLMPGESQSVAGAMLVSQGTDYLVSITRLREDAGVIRWLWDNNLENLDLFPHVTIYSGPENNSEDEGPYEFIFQIHNVDQLNNDNFIFASAWGTDPDYFEPQTLSQVNDSLFSVIIERENTDIEFNYYLQLGEFDGLEIAYPNAAPENYHTLLLGPDLILPMIDSLSNLPQAHYLLPVKQYVTVVGIWDDRFGVQTPVLGWEFPDGTTGSAEMELVYQVFDGINQVWKKDYSGFITGFGEGLDGDVSYWVTVADSSQNENVGSSEIKSFQLGQYEVLGNWEDEIRRDWNFIQGSFQTMNIEGSFQFNNALVENSSQDDTTFYLRPLDLTHFNEVWLSVPMVITLNENEAFVEITNGNGGWTELATYQFDGYEIFVPNHYDLSPFTDQDSLYFRFRFNNLTGGFAEWIFDDIFIHNIPEWLDADENILPTSFALFRPYPNPFNPITTIRFDIPVETGNEVALRIFDINGRLVETLVNQKLEPGTHEVQWYANNHASGIYFIRMVAGEFVKTQKMILLK